MYCIICIAFILSICYKVEFHKIFIKPLWENTFSIQKHLGNKQINLYFCSPNFEREKNECSE